MSRHIILAEDEQENVNPFISYKNKQAPQSSQQQSMIQEEDVLADSYWKTNLMITDEEDRVKRRNKGTRKNTSFQNRIINDHVWVMIRQLCKKDKNSSIQQDKLICEQISTQQLLIKIGINQEKIRHYFQENIYFTQDEKVDLIQKFLLNFQNYQILNKLITRLHAIGQYKDEHVFIIVKIVAFISQNYELKYRKYDENFLLAQLSKTLNRICEYIVNHENVKVINPEYFYNSNQPIYMKIIEVWFYSIFSIKLGLIDNKYLQTQKQSKMSVQE